MSKIGKLDSIMKIRKFIFLFGVLILNLLPSFSQLCINEFMAGNKTGLKDNKGKFSDWIEIYNSGNEAIDLAGYYLSDTLGDPGKSKIKKSSLDSTIINSHGYLVLFADGKTINGVLHLSFKLKKNGEQLGLFKKEGKSYIQVDAITYKKQFNDVSFGRVPDGSKKLEYIQTPSPGATNNDAATGKPPMKIKNLPRPTQ
jgi:hypothetical protein